MSVSVIDVGLPERPDDGSEAARLFRGFVDVRNAVRRHAWVGNDDLDFSLQETFISARDSREERQHRFAALLAGRVVGFARVEVGLHEPAAPAQLVLGVLPEHRRLGIGTALLRCAEEALRFEGRATTQLWVEHPEIAGPRLSPGTGHGSIPAHDPGAVALQGAGFSLEQAERISVLELDGDAAAALKRERPASVPHGCRLLTWEGRTPDHLLQAMAELGARMSTDAPTGGLDTVEEVWDAERLAAFERTEIDGAGRRYLTAAVFDASGIAVAFSKLLLPATRTRQAIQQETLVHVDHRGQGLGMLVKTENMLQLRRHHPECERIITWNAEENVHMISVNERLGFRRVMTEGAWQRRENRLS